MKGRKLKYSCLDPVTVTGEGVGLSYSPTPSLCKLLSTSIIYGMMLQVAIYLREQSAAWRIEVVKKGGANGEKNPGHGR